MAIFHACLYASQSEYFVIPGLCMSKIYATTMLVIFNNRIKIVGGRFDQDEDEECALGTTRFSETRDQRRESRDTSSSLRTTKVLVSNKRLTFQLSDVPPASDFLSAEDSQSSSSVRNVRVS